MGAALLFFPLEANSGLGLLWGIISVSARLPLTMAWHICFVLVYKHLKVHSNAFISSPFMTANDGANVHDGYLEYMTLQDSVESTCQGSISQLIAFVLLAPIVCIVLALKVSNSKSSSSVVVNA